MSFLLPRAVSSSPVAAKRITKLASSAWLMKCLVPLMTKSSPSARAKVFMPRRSEPTSGSVSARQSDFSPRIEGKRYFSRCSPVQAKRMFEGLATQFQCSA